MKFRSTTTKRVAFAATLLAGALTLSACAGPAGQSSSASGGGDGPATLWVRASDAPIDKSLVTAWNTAHPKQKISMVAIPDAQYVQKFLQGIRSGDVPDISVVDIANAKALVTAKVLTDLTAKIDALPYAKNLAPGAIAVGSDDGKKYAVPHQLDVSLLYYNTALFKKAGISGPPTTAAEIAEDAKKITALGHDTSGFYFAGNCAGCNAYTTLPFIWANGGNILNADGTKTTLGDPSVSKAMDLFKTMWDDKSIPASAANDNGATWITSFQSNKIGMLPLGSFGISVYGIPKGPQFGVAPIPGADGGTAAFLGGDVVGIPENAKQKGTAWDFIKWSMSKDAQQNIVAKAGSLVVRTDLIDNPVTAADPRRLTANELIKVAKVPDTAKYNSLFIDSTGPFLQFIRSWVFDGEGSGAIAGTQSAWNARLAN